MSVFCVIMLGQHVIRHLSNFIGYSASTIHEWSRLWQYDLETTPRVNWHQLFAKFEMYATFYLAMHVVQSAELLS